MRKKLIEKLGKGTSGITIIALIVSIIILLILSAITINMVLDGGLISKTKKIVDEPAKVENKEEQQAINEIIESRTDPIDDEYVQEGMVAKLNEEYYPTLQQAIDRVPKDDSRQTIYLLKNISENVEISANQNIQLELRNHTITNLNKGKEIINLNGKLKMISGKVIGNFEAKVPTIKMSNNAEITLSTTDIDRASTSDYLWETVELRSGSLSIDSGTMHGNSNVICTYSDGVANINISGRAKLSNEGTKTLLVNKYNMTISGGTLSSDQSYCIKNTGTVTLTGGTLTAKRSNCLVNLGTLNVEKNAKITGSNYVETDDTTYPAVINDEDGVMTVKGGTLVGKESCAIYNMTGGNLTVTGGSITSEKSCCISNFGTATIKERVQITGNNYINELGNVFPALLNQANGTMTINGGTINAGEGNGIANRANGKLTITAGTINGKGNSAVKNEGTMEMTGGDIIAEKYNCVTNTGTITMDDGEITGSDYSEEGGEVYPAVINYANGKITMTGGTMTGGEGNTLWNKENGTVKITHGLVYGRSYYIPIYNEGNIEITGGTVTSKESNCVANLNTMTIGGSVDINGSNLVEDDGTVYPSVVNMQNATMTVTGGWLTGGKSHALWNMATGTLTMTGGTVEGKNSFILRNEGKAEITGGRVYSYEKSNALANYGTITIGGGVKIEGTTDPDSDTPAVINDKNATMTMIGGTITGGTGYSLWNKTSGTLTVTGGTVIGTNNFALRNDGTIPEISGTVKITRNSSSYTLYNTGTITSIKGGTIENTSSGYALYNSGGTVNYTSGTVGKNNVNI